MSNNLTGKIEPLVVIEDRLQDQDMPAAVRENVHRHYEHLTRLAENLRNFGMEQEAIDGHVIEIFEEYKRELEANIGRIKVDRQSRQSDETSR